MEKDDPQRPHAAGGAAQILLPRGVWYFPSGWLHGLLCPSPQAMSRLSRRLQICQKSNQVLNFHDSQNVNLS
jgi:hypothetical protein